MSNEYKLSYTASDINTKLGYLDGLTGNIKEKLDSAAYTALLAMPGSLKWDGVIGDKEYISLGEDTYFVRIYDEVPTILEAMAIIGMNMYFEPMAGMTEGFEVADDGSVILGETFIIVPYDGWSMDGITFSKKGIYTIAMNAISMGYDVSMVYGSGLYIFGYTFSDSGADKYFEGGNSTTDVLTFDGNIGDKTKVLLMSGEDSQGVTEIYHVKLSDSTPTMSDLASGANITVFSPEGSEGGLIPVDDIIQADNGAIYIGDAIVVIIPSDNFTSSKLDGVVFPEKGIYVQCLAINGSVDAYISSLSIPNYTFQVDGGKVIKTEHLPKALQFGEITTKGANFYNGARAVNGALVWDGTTANVLENLEACLVTDDISFIGKVLSSGTEGITVETFSGSTITNLTGSAPVDDLYMLSYYDTSAGLDVCIVVATKDAVTLETFIFPKKGVYFVEDVKSLSVAGHTFLGSSTTLVPIDSKYLPEPIIFDITDTANITCNKTYAKCKANPYQQFFFKKMVDGATQFYHGMITGINADSSLSYANVLALNDAIQYNPDGTITLVD